MTPLPGCIGKTRSTQGLSTMPPSWLGEVTILTSVPKPRKKCPSWRSLLSRTLLSAFLLWSSGRHWIVGSEIAPSFVWVDASRLPFLFGNIIPGIFFGGGGLLKILIQNSSVFSFRFSLSLFPSPRPFSSPSLPLPPSPFRLNLFPSLKVL